jgi:cytochrome c biogenesis protein CcmG/thiol:disulfide interchange protein DsbE
MRGRAAAVIVAASLLAAACAPSVPLGDVPPLPAATPADLHALLAASDRPVVVNVWASWCAPCRSEAPLLRAAAAEWGDRVRFVGIDVRDSQDGARRFIAEFGLTALEHYFDAAGAIPDDLGGIGVPITFFFAAGGEPIGMHAGVLDERSLALGIDDALRAGP